MSIIEVWCDGSITGGPWGKKHEKHLPPHAWSGWVARGDGQVLHFQSVDLGEGDYMSANVAEYMAIRSALRWLGDKYADQSLKINSDSQLIINQMKGVFTCSKPQLVRLRDSCLSMARKFPSVTYHWIRREHNREADVLSKALQIWGRQPTWEEVEGFLFR